ncbi:hypothetical protein IW261DRAFT_1436717 [Armillaria novae-zelandiae]|uniref:Protein kinase domain-containing protein n=1 Tax=Armillaria novae-zelandiae TaxID=153914 RepID=A0AA39PWX6_9AGAR|nr:hypothetical protein IW261DRAFT_1436717 [Armillaria novae-zelandiae]
MIHYETQLFFDNSGFISLMLKIPVFPSMMHMHDSSSEVLMDSTHRLQPIKRWPDLHSVFSQHSRVLQQPDHNEATNNTRHSIESVTVEHKEFFFSKRTPNRPDEAGDHHWLQINFDDEEISVRTQIQNFIRNGHRPWTSVTLIPPLVETMVMDVLQQELDDVTCSDGYRTSCMKCLQALNKARNIVPSSFSSREVTREGTNPIGGGGFSDIWLGRLHDTRVCLKVLRIFVSGETQERIFKDFCREALVWRQLRHPNILPFLGVSEELFAPSYCLISPWMANGNIIHYLEAHPGHDRLLSARQPFCGS